MLEKRKETYERITEAVQAMIRNSDPTTAASLQKQLDEVKEAWDQVSTKAEEEGHKLDDALKNAEEWEKQLTDMDSWLTQVHDRIVSFDHVSSILDVLEKQRHEHKVRNKGQKHYFVIYHLNPLDTMLSLNTVFNDSSFAAVFSLQMCCMCFIFVCFVFEKDFITEIFTAIIYLGNRKFVWLSRRQHSRFPLADVR